MSPGNTTCVLRDLEVLMFKHEHGSRGEAMFCHQGLRPVEAHRHLARKTSLNIEVLHI